MIRWLILAGASAFVAIAVWLDLTYPVDIWRRGLSRHGAPSSLAFASLALASASAAVLLWRCARVSANAWIMASAGILLVTVFPLNAGTSRTELVAHQAGAVTFFLCANVGMCWWPRLVPATRWAVHAALIFTMLKLAGDSGPLAGVAGLMQRCAFAAIALALLLLARGLRV